MFHHLPTELVDQIFVLACRTPTTPPGSYGSYAGLAGAADPATTTNLMCVARRFYALLAPLLYRAPLILYSWQLTRLHRTLEHAPRLAQLVEHLFVGSASMLTCAPDYPAESSKYDSDTLCRVLKLASSVRTLALHVPQFNCLASRRMIGALPRLESLVIGPPSPIFGPIPVRGDVWLAPEEPITHVRHLAIYHRITENVEDLCIFTRPGFALGGVECLTTFYVDAFVRIGRPMLDALVPKYTSTELPGTWIPWQRHPRASDDQLAQILGIAPTLTASEQAVLAALHAHTPDENPDQRTRAMAFLEWLRFAALSPAAP